MTITWGFPDGSVGKESTCHAGDTRDQYNVMSVMFVAISSLNHVWLFVTARTVAHQPPGSPVHGFSRQEYWEWVAISSSKGSSQPRDQTCVSCSVVSCIASGFFTDRATREALYTSIKKIVITEKIINSNWYSHSNLTQEFLLLCSAFLYL